MMIANFDVNPALNTEINLDTLQSHLFQQNRNSWHMEATRTPKLETFVKIHDFESRKVLLHANLERRHRSLVIKLKSGVFPLEKEMARYIGVHK